MFNVENISVIADERLKKIISEVFDRIYKKYGEQNFSRWINEAKFDDKIKTLIVKYTTLKEEPYAGGYYNRNKNTLAIQETYSYESTFKVFVHEFNHFLTPDNFIKEMTGFINEGITEYLTQRVDERGYKAYKYNVDFTAFLHKQIGDILIKSYFTGETSKVKSKLETYLSPKFNLTFFLSELKEIYDKCYCVPQEVKESVIASKMDFLANTYMQIYLGRIIESANAMEYYTNGNIDQAHISQTLANINSMFPDYVIKYINEHNLMAPYKENIVRAILNNSHLRHSDYYGNDNIKIYVDAIINGRTIQIPNNNAIQLLLLDKLKNTELNINEYADIILMVINKFPNFNVEDLNKMEFLIDKVGEDKFKIIYDYVINNINRYSNINEFVNEHERNTIESQFRVIVPNWYYLEKRDNKLYIIKMDGNGKVIEETPITEEYGKTFDIKGLYLSNREGQLCKTSITLDEDFSKIKIHPEVSTIYKDVYDLEDFQKLIKTMPFISQIKDRLKKNKTTDKNPYEPFFGVEGVYYQINNCGIRAHDDYRTIHLDINGLKRDFDILISLFPKNNKEEMLLEILKEILRDIYEIDYSSEIDWCSKALYDVLYNGKSKSSVLDIEGLLNHLKNQKNDFIKSKYELAFKDETSKQEYYRRKREYEAKLERLRKSEELIKERKAKEAEEAKIKTFENNHRYGYIKYERSPQYTNPEAQFDLPAVKHPQDIREPGFESIDIENLIKNMKSYISLCKGKKDYEPYIISTINTTIKNFLEIIDTEEAKELFNSLYTMIYNSIFEEKEIDMTSFENLINRSNEYISKHANFWPTRVEPERDRMVDLLNKLHDIMGDTEQFEKIVIIVREHILTRGYDETIYKLISSIIETNQLNNEEYKKKN